MDPRLAADIVGAVDERFAQLQRSLPRTAYGVVTAVDTVNRKATVRVSGETTASGGFVFPRLLRPAVGELVRVVIDPRGDRYVDDALPGFGRLRYVAMRTVHHNGASASSSFGPVVSGPVANVPTNARLLVMELRVTSTVPNPGNWAAFYHSDAASAALVVFNGSAAGYQNTGVTLVAPEDGNKFYIQLAVAAGIITYTTIVVGYFTDDN